MGKPAPVPVASDEPSGVLAELSGRVPHLAEYFGVWAFEDQAFRAIVDRCQGMDLAAHVATQQRLRAEDGGGDSGKLDVRVEKGVAIVPLRGALMKSVGSLEEGTSTVWARRQIRLAAADERVKAIMLVIDSPGGTVSGTQDLANDVAAAAKAKPVHAHIEDLGASAAYWIASQASRVTANATGLVGSIGTYLAVQDLSGRAAQLGVKVHVLRAGEFKGSGVAGTEITAAQLAQWQALVDALNEHFLAGVAKGRKLGIARVRSIADGRVHVAADAKELGLVDAVESFDAAFAAIAKESKQDKGARMSDATETKVEAPVTIKPQPASYHELVSACPGADPGWLCKQLEANATREQAASAWLAEMSSRLEASRRELAEAKAAAAKPGVPALPTGTAPAGGDSAETADAAEAWQEALSQKLKTMPRAKAIAALVRERPDLHRAMLVAHNQDHGRRDAAARLQRA